MAGRTAFTIRAQTGCEEQCAYCIIPSTRGASRSLRVEDLVREIARVAAAGFKEVTLAGVHLGSYGRDLTPPSSLYALLRALDMMEGDITFRISSLEPMACTPGIRIGKDASPPRTRPSSTPVEIREDMLLPRARIREITAPNGITLIASLDEKGRLDWEEVFMDASFSPAKKGGPESERQRRERVQSG